MLLCLSLLCIAGKAANFQVDTVSLWQGTEERHGEEVSLYAYRPEHPAEVSVIVCPGGSYHWLDSNGEGFKVAEWLCSNGITAFVLLYRTAGCAEIAWHTRILFRGKRHPDMICDAQRAIKYIRENAAKYRIDPDKVGIMGFSAGGHLAMSTACFCGTDFQTASPNVDRRSLRPDFVAAIYPVVTMRSPFVHKRSRRGILGDSRLANNALKDSLSIELHIPSDCPPVFMINCHDDPVVPYQNSELLDIALSEKNIPHKYIQYERGRHGFGVSDYYGSPECREWRNEFLNWLKSIYCSL